MDLLRPAVEWELSGAISQIAQNKQRIAVNGGGSRSTVGAELHADVRLELGYLRGIIRSEPTERMMTAMAGTPLREVERELSRLGLMLAFEPVDLGPILGGPAYNATIGGTFAADMAGSRRIVAGRARDALCGATVVTGRGDILALGGPQPHLRRHPDVMSALCGSWGTLAVMTQVSFQVSALPEETASVLVADLTDAAAVQAMADALSAQAGVTGAVHLDAALSEKLPVPILSGARQPFTLLRIEGPSVLLPQRLSRLRTLLSAYGDCAVLADADSLELWAGIQMLLPFQDGDGPLWRIVIRPHNAAAAIRGLRRYSDFAVMMDWGGGVIWLAPPASLDAGAADIRRVLATLGGHATLVRAAPDVRNSVDCFEPMDLAMEPVLKRLKTAFDPAGVFNHGRLYAGL